MTLYKQLSGNFENVHRAAWRQTVPANDSTKSRHSALLKNWGQFSHIFIKVWKVWNRRWSFIFSWPSASLAASSSSTEGATRTNFPGRSSSKPFPNCRTNLGRRVPKRCVKDSFSSCAKRLHSCTASWRCFTWKTDSGSEWKEKFCR